MQVLQQSQLHKFHFEFLWLCGLQFCECASFTAVCKFHRRVAHLSSLRACSFTNVNFLNWWQRHINVCDEDDILWCSGSPSFMSQMLVALSVTQSMTATTTMEVKDDDGEDDYLGRFHLLNQEFLWLRSLGQVSITGSPQLTWVWKVQSFASGTKISILSSFNGEFSLYQKHLRRV